MPEVVDSAPSTSSDWANLPPELVGGIARFLMWEDGSVCHTKAFSAGRLTCRHFSLHLMRGVGTINARGTPPTRCSSPLLENVRRLHWDFRTRKYHNNGICTRCKPATEFLGALQSLEELVLDNIAEFPYMTDIVDALAPHGRIRSLQIFGNYCYPDSFLTDVSRLGSLETLGLFAGLKLTERSILLMSRLKGLQSLSIRFECDRFSDDEGATQVTVLESLSLLKSLRDLNIRTNARIDSALVAFSAMPVMEAVSVEYDRSSDTPGQGVLRAYSDNGSKTTLSYARYLRR